MNKIISIVGPTATGKTNFALKKAIEVLNLKENTGIDIISADSRQVYKGLEIINGADVPPGYSQIGKIWSNPGNTIAIHGISIIEPNQEWSLGHFQEFAQEVIRKSWQKNRYPIVVGGTGLYHDHLLDLSDKIRIKPNKKIRQKAETLSLEELQDWLNKLNPDHFQKLNNSDKNNPRRLVRAIEIAIAPKSKPIQENQNYFSKTEITVIGVMDSLENIQKKIQKRVDIRFKNGAIEEVKNLYKNYNDLSDQVKTTMGVKEIRDYIDNKIDKNKCLDQWKLREFQYAKRQITWWKNAQNIRWIESR